MVSKELLSQKWGEAFARNHDIPIAWAEKGVRKEDHVLPWLRKMVRKDAYGLCFILALHALAIFSSYSVLEAAEFDEVATGERPARLLQAATGRETAEVDWHEAKALDHAFDEFGRLRVIPGDEDDGAATILYGSFIEASGDDRIEGLHDSGARRQAGYHFASPLAAQVGQHQFWAVLDERICSIDDHSAVPRWKAA